MKFDRELSELAELLRVGSETARTIADARGRDRTEILALAAQADDMAAAIRRIVGDRDGEDRELQLVASLRLRRDR